MSSQGVWDKCLDEALFAQNCSVRSGAAKPKPPAPVVQVSSQHAMEPPAPLLSEEVRRLEKILSVNVAEP